MPQKSSIFGLTPASRRVDDPGANQGMECNLKETRKWQDDHPEAARAASRRVAQFRAALGPTLVLLLVVAFVLRPAEVARLCGLFSNTVQHLPLLPEPLLPEQTPAASFP